MTGLVLAAVWLSAGAAFGQGQQCATPAEQAAGQARRLQSELMVGMLTCRERAELNMVGRYSAAMRGKSDFWAAQGKSLTDHFGRLYGREGQRRMDAFVTQLANEAAQRAQRTPDFCAYAARLHDQVQAAPAMDALVRDWAQERGIKGDGCRP
ncbi:MAG: hypothetical protein FJX46_11130 [Alphaproteobacteria bacterium]|nr:hypothetical protein [Alphaproteobacteria bacterium]